jgi:hypothetical protein
MEQIDKTTSAAGSACSAPEEVDPPVSDIPQQYLLLCYHPPFPL